MFKRLLGGILSGVMLISTAAPVFAAEGQEIGAPRNAAVPAAATTHSSISILWDKPEDYKDITGYNVYIDGVFAAKTAANETYYTAEDLAPNSEHTFTVKALIDEAESAASNEVTARTDVRGAVHDVTEAPYNAVGDGTANDTAAIQAAIDDCAANDIVLLPEGKTFLSGALDLKSNMTLEVNGTLAGIQTASEYEKKGDTATYEGGTTSTGSVYTGEAPKRLIWSRVEGWEQYCYRSLINIGSLTKGTNYGETDTYNVTNVKIIGKGEITGSNNDYKTRYDPIDGQANYLAQEEGNSAETFYDLEASNSNGVSTNNIRSRIRGRLINVSNAQNVYIKGVTVSRPPMWTVHMIYSDNITTNGVTFETSGYRNGDGWDPDSSSNCTIYDCDFRTGDDCVAIKSGKNPEGNEINRPAENIKVIGCRSNGGLGLAVGSEMSGGVDGVIVRDCELSNTRYGVELKASPVRGGYIKNFTVQDSTIDQVLIHSVDYNADGEPAGTPPEFRDIHFKNTTIISRDGYNKDWLSTPIQIDGFDNDTGEGETEDYYISNVTFEDVTVGTAENVRQTISMKKSRNIAFNNVLQSNGKQPKYTDSDATFTVDGGEYTVPEPDFEGIKGSINKTYDTYTWEIGKAAATENGTTYSDSDKTYAELTVGLGNGDTMTADGINFTASSVKESTTSGQASVADTQRYLLVKPKYNGTMKVAIKFTSGTQTNNRIYYKDFLGGSVNFAQCKKDTSDGMMTGSEIGANVEKTMTLDMTAGHTYVLYTYQNSSTISELSYSGMTDVPIPETYTVTFDYGNDSRVTRTVNDGETVSDIPEPPSKDIIKLSNGHENSGVLIKAVYKQDNTPSNVTVSDDNITLTSEQTEYDLPAVNENEKYFLWNSLDNMKPLGAMEQKTAIWGYNGYKFTENTVVKGDITVTPSYSELEDEPVTPPTDNPDNPPAEKKTASITIKYVDEEKNKIKDDITLNEEFTDGDAYSLPEEYTKNFALKTQEGLYNHYNFNNGTSDIPTKYSENMTVTLVFNNDEQYDFYEDFEDYTLNASEWKKGADCADPTLETDNTKYAQLRAGTSSTGAYTNFSEVNTEGKAVHITADVKFAPSDTTGEAQFPIANTLPGFSSNNINYGFVNDKAGHIITLAYKSTHKLLVNGKEISGDGITSADFIGDWIHIDADADFGAETADITITNSEGNKAVFTGVNFFSSSVAGNIGAFYLRGAGVSGIAAVDNITVKITGEGGTPIPNIESPINLKTVYAFGDSIVYGHNYPETSFMRLIANDYAIKLKMMAKNGATIMPSSNRILTQINNAPAAEPDIVVFEGYTNDAYGSAESDPEFNPTGSNSDVTQCYGEITEGTTQFDENTFCGSFEKTIQTIKQKWPNSKVVFITIHKSGARNFDIQTKLHDLTVAMCEKWGVDVVDMFKDSALDTRDATQMYNYMIDHKGSHPNVAACREFYIPAIVEKLEALCGGGDDPEPEEPADLTEDETEPQAINTYNFDFVANADDADEGSYPVTKTSEYNTTFGDDGLQYGLYGANINDYKLNNYVDGVTTTKGQLSVYLDGEDCIGPYEVTGEETQGDDGYGQIAGLYPIRFSMAGKNGGYYRVKVTLKGLDGTKDADATLYSERRHPIITNKTIPAGESKTVEFTATLQNVAIKNRTTGGTDTYRDDKVNVVAVGENIAIDKIEIKEIAHQPTIFMYDDSTGCDYAMILPYFDLQNYGGTGQFISKYLRESYAVANQGDGGINAADNIHWNAAKESIQAGDYVYVQYGHNHKNDGAKGYVQSLNKYYDYAHDKGAYTILAGPIDRHNSSQYDKTTNTWSSTLGGYSKAADYFTRLMILRGPAAVAEFVNKVKASSSKSIDADIYTWADGEIAKGLDAENGRSDIAFVDLNAPTLEWLSEVCETVKTQRGLDTYSASYTDYYFLSRKGTSVDGTHANDAGADNTAKFFFDGAKAIVTKKDKDAVETVMADVLKPLVTNMRSASPEQVSENIVKQGSAPNSAWPVLYKSSNAAQYPTAIKEITWNEDGTIDTVAILKQESTTYMSAYGILELVIKDNEGNEKGTIYSTQIDNTWDDGSLTNFSLEEETNKLTGDTSAVYDEEAGDTFTAIVWQATDDGSGLGIYKDREDNPVPYSEYYSLSDGSGQLLTNEDGESPEDFDFYGAVYTGANASSINGNNGWVVNGSSGSKNTTLGIDDERHYANIQKTVNSGSFFIYKKLDNEISAAGKVSFSMDLQYIGGSGIYLGVANSFYKKGSPWFNNQLRLMTFDANSGDSGNTANVKATNGSTTTTVGTISKDAWTTVTGTLDIDNGKMTVKVGDGAETETTISNYDTIFTDITPSTLAAFYLAAGGSSVGGIRISNLSITKLAGEDLPTKTLTISPSYSNLGTVAIDGSNALTVTDTQNAEVKISAAGKTEDDKFLGWYEGDTLISEKETLSLRLHRDMTLVARFKHLTSVTITSAVNDASYGSVTINGSADTTFNVLEDETVTLRAISKEGYKFVSWTKDGSEVSKTPSYTITATESAAYTSNFAALDEGETVWEFTDIADAEAVTTTDATAEKTYGNFEIHLGKDGDSVSADGIAWKGPGTTTSDNKAVSNNRYIKYTASKSGTLNINFQSTYQASASNNNPRMYIVSGEDESCMSKNNGDSANSSGVGKSYTLSKVNSVEALSLWVTKGTTYYIFGYCYNNSLAPFTISSISFVEPKTYTVTASAISGGSILIDGVAENTKEIVEGEMVTLTAVPDEGNKLTGWKNGSKAVSASYEYTFKVESNTTLTAEFEAKGASEQLWDFSNYRAANAVSATGEQTVTDESISNIPLSIHLVKNDKINGSGICFAGPSLTSGGGTDQLNNNRYITFTAPSDGTLKVSFMGAEVNVNNKPRLYVTVGDDKESMIKNNATEAGSATGKMTNASGANTPTVHTMTVTANTTYSIWTNLYNKSNCAFTISSISFTPNE